LVKLNPQSSILNPALIHPEFDPIAFSIGPLAVR